MYIFSAFAYFAKDGIRSKQCIRPRILADSCRADHLCTVQHIAFHGARSAQLARRRCCCCCCCREFNAWFIQFDAWCMCIQFSSVQFGWVGSASQRAGGRRRLLQLTNSSSAPRHMHYAWDMLRWAGGQSVAQPDLYDSPGFTRPLYIFIYSILFTKHNGST